MPNIEHRSVVVVGAGPGGTSCARRLAEAGMDVLVLERRAVVGHPAQCGECIPNWGEIVHTFRGLENHEWLIDSFDVPDRIRLHRLDAMRVFLPSGRSYDFSLDAYAGHRAQFDGHLAERAVEAGAELRVGVALQRLHQQRRAGREVLVTSDGGRLTCDHLVDASGALAHVARLRHGTDAACRPSDQVPTVYAQVRGEVPPTFDVFLGSVAPSGYAWIIPKGPDTANVGLGVRAGYLEGRLKDHLERFCSTLGFEILEVGGGWIPMGGPVRRMVDGNALAVGDAAGLVMPSNGGGISQAVISGCFAADAILDHVREGAPLEAYQKRVEWTFGPALRNSLRSKQLGYAFMRNDVLTEGILRMLGPIGGIRRAMECGRPLWVL